MKRTLYVTTKSKNIHVFNLTDPVYKFSVGLIFGGTYQEALTSFEKNTGVKLDAGPGTTFGCFRHDEKGVCVMWLPRNTNSSVIGHEVIHLVFTMLEMKGVPTAVQNQETFAYHWQWWFDTIRSSIGQAKKKGS